MNFTYTTKFEPHPKNRDKCTHRTEKLAQDSHPPVSCGKHEFLDFDTYSGSNAIQWPSSYQNNQTGECAQAQQPWERSDDMTTIPENTTN
jgi:hypothetical protein